MHLVHGSVRQARLASCGLLLTAGMTVFGADGPASTNAPSPRLRSWELPAITVEGRTSDLLREEELVGSYGQPRWTTQRRFPRVRVYVLPEDEREFEYWTRVDVPRHGPCEVQHFFEFEIGLPYRLQLDTYLVVRNEDGGFDGPTFYDGQFELRYALADTVHARGSFATSTFLGPSLQFRPVPNMHIDFTPLFGLNGGEQAKIFFNAG